MKKAICAVCAMIIILMLCSCGAQQEGGVHAGRKGGSASSATPTPTQSGNFAERVADGLVGTVEKANDKASLADVRQAITMFITSADDPTEVPATFIFVDGTGKNPVYYIYNGGELTECESAPVLGSKINTSGVENWPADFSLYRVG